VDRWLSLDLPGLARRRLELLRVSLLRIVQAAAAGTLAWWLAEQIPHHPRPFFAPIAAVIAMIQVPGTRGKQAIGLIVGVLIGIGVAGLVVAVAGTGTWQLGVAVALAMAASILVGGRPIVVGQAAGSAILLVALHRPGAAPGRLLDALVGGGVAILVATILFPIDPLALVREAGRETAAELAAAIDEIAQALRRHDPQRGRLALRRLDAVDPRRLDETLEIARGVVRRAPRRRWERRAVEAYAEATQELHAAVVDARALASGALRLLRDGQRLPDGAAAAAESLAAALRARSTTEAEAAADRARASAAAALEQSPSLGLNVFAHAIDTVAAHAARAAAAAEHAPARRRARGPLRVPG
jgi:uncharacterized membrane protein YgaE (UPF0421/DUF939 family)